jgi:YVTN family beta-propeller protein
MLVKSPGGALAFPMALRVLRFSIKSVCGLLLAVPALLLADAQVATIGVGNGPSAVAFSPSGAYAYVANASPDVNNGRDTVSVINTSALAVVATISGFSHPGGLVVSPDGSLVYVSNTYADSVSVIDTATNTIKATIANLDSPSKIAVSPDGTHVFVITGSAFNVSESETLSVIDTKTGAVAVASAKFETSDGLAVTPDGSAIYLTDGVDGVILEFDAGTLALLARLTDYQYAGQIAISPDGSIVYVSNELLTSVTEVSTSANSAVAIISPVFGAGAIALTPDGTAAYVTSTGGYTVINTRSKSIAQVDDGTDELTSAAVTPDGAYVYFTNYSAGTVEVIERAPTVLGLSPGFGAPSGETTVAISGTGFVNATAVFFGPTPAASFTVNSDSSITALSPPGASGLVDVTIASQAGTSATNPLDIFQFGSVGRLANLSARAEVGSGANILIAGFVIAGPGRKNVILRGVGPTLATAPFDVNGVLPDPQLALFSGAGTQEVTDGGWDSSVVLADAFAAVGAFPLQQESADSAFQSIMLPGQYTCQLSGAHQDSGIALVEIYDADTGIPTASLVNISARASIGAGGNLLIAGFVVEGNGPVQVLLRGVGPTLAVAPFNVPGAISNTTLALYDSTGALIAKNLGWGNPLAPGASTVSATVKLASPADMSSVGAFALSAGSADSALVAILPPGAYTVQVSGMNGSTGVGLAEVYLFP